MSPPGVESRLASLTLDKDDFSKLSKIASRPELPSTFQPENISQLVTAVPALFNMLNVRRAIIPGAITDIAQLVLLHATMQLLLTEAWSHHLIPLCPRHPLVPTHTFPNFLQRLPPKSRKGKRVRQRVLLQRKKEMVMSSR